MRRTADAEAGTGIAMAINARKVNKKRGKPRLGDYAAEALPADTKVSVLDALRLRRVATGAGTDSPAAPWSATPVETATCGRLETGDVAGEATRAPSLFFAVTGLELAEGASDS